MQAGLLRTSGHNYGRWVSSPNLVRYALSRPFEADPGGPMLYSTGSTHLLSAMLTRASGRSTHALVQEWLAVPLDISIPTWPADPQGIYFGGNEMRMSPRALVRFGELYRLDGIVDGRRILPAGWVRESWTPRTVSPWSGQQYGFGWFIAETRGHPVRYGWGYGGQMVYVVPDLRLTVAITSDDGGARDGGHINALNALLADQIIPAAERGGDLADLDSIAASAGDCDGVIHLAFGHDFTKYKEAGETDRRAVEAMARVLEGSGKPLVITSGTTIVAVGQTTTEEQPARSDTPSGVRAPSEHVLTAASERGVRGVVVRLPPSVHGEGDHGFVPALIDVARERRVAAYVGDGANRWPAVHRLDAARLFRLALETGRPGARLHGADEEGIPMREIAAIIGDGLRIPVRGLAPGQAEEHLGWLSMFVGLDNPTSSAATRELVGWRPSEIGLLADLQEHYFARSRG